MSHATAAKLLSEEETATYLSMSRVWLRTCRCNGIGGPPFHRLGRSIRYSIDDLDAWLDEQHLDQLIKQYFLHASPRVIILSTVTEIDKSYFQDLEPHLARAYHLDYGENQKQSVARDGYFWNKLPEAELKETGA